MDCSLVPRSPWLVRGIRAGASPEGVDVGLGKGVAIGGIWVSGYGRRTPVEAAS